MMTTIPSTNVPRTDLIGRIRRAQTDLVSIGKCTDPVANELPTFEHAAFEKCVERYQQPSLPEMIAAAKEDAAAARTSAHRWLTGVGVSTIATVAATAACAFVAPSLAPAALMAGGTLTAAVSVRAGVGFDRKERIDATRNLLEGWQLAYDRHAVNGQVATVNSVPYH